MDKLQSPETLSLGGNVREKAGGDGDRKSQGPRSNFAIGRGGGTISDSILGGAQNTFSYQFFIIFKILGGTSPPPAAPPTPRSLNRLVPGVHYSCLCLVATESDLKPEKIKSSSLDIFGFKFLFHD